MWRREGQWPVCKIRVAIAAAHRRESEEQPPPRRELANIFASQAHVHVQAVWALALADDGATAFVFFQPFVTLPAGIAVQMAFRAFYSWR